MTLLLDTHVLLWWLDDDDSLAAEVRDAIVDTRNLVFVSGVVTWEITIKRALGKLDTPDDWLDVLRREPFRDLPITWTHTAGLAELPDIHRDPFDRLLVSQAAEENMVLATQDRKLTGYDVRTIGL